MAKDVHGLCEQTVWLRVYDLVYVLLPRVRASMLLRACV